MSGTDWKGRNIRQQMGKIPQNCVRKNCLKKSKILLTVVIDMVVVGVKYKYYVCELLFPEFLQSIPKKPTSCFNV